MTAGVSWRAVDNIEISSILLKARMLAIGHESSNRGSMTAGVSWRAVAFIEITSNLLKARMLAIGHESSKRGSMTARVEKRAVAFAETNFCLLLIKNSYKNVLPSHNIKFRKIDCF